MGSRVASPLFSKTLVTRRVKMRGKTLLAAFLLGVGLCFVPTFGHGEVDHRAYELKAPFMDLTLLEARVDYMMTNPTNFLVVRFHYDPNGGIGRIEKFPARVDTKGKILVVVYDSRDIFSYESGKALLDLFKRKLETIYSFVDMCATDMETDIVAKFYSGKEIPLGYFYQGEYYLWKK